MTLRAFDSPESIRRLYPPRTESAMPPEKIAKFKGFIAQYKYNDIRTLIDLFPDGEIELLTRQREPVKEYQLTPHMRESLRGIDLSADGYHVLDGGIMRHLKIGRESPIILWDILVHNGQYLLGTTYRSRYELLRKLCGNPEKLEKVTGRRIGYEIHGRLWLAPIYDADFEKLYHTALEADYLEGLFLKNPNGKLERGFHEKNNSSWQIKFRKPRKDYQF